MESMEYHPEEYTQWSHLAPHETTIIIITQIMIWILDTQLI